MISTITWAKDIPIYEPPLSEVLGLKGRDNEAEGWRISPLHQRIRAVVKGVKIASAATSSNAIQTTLLATAAIVGCWIFRQQDLTTYEKWFRSLSLYGLSRFALWEFSVAIDHVIYEELIPSSYLSAYQRVFSPNGKKDAVLLIRAKADYNGGIYKKSKTELNILQELSKEYSLFERRASSIDDINRSLRELRSLGKRICLLWLCAHGSDTGIELKPDLGKNCIFSTSGRSLGQGINFSTLTRDATIFLMSCSTGKPREKGLNVAEELNRHSGRRVIAPDIDFDITAVKLLDVRTRTFAFYQKGQDHTRVHTATLPFLEVEGDRAEGPRPPEATTLKVSRLVTESLDRMIQMKSSRGRLPHVLAGYVPQPGALTCKKSMVMAIHLLALVLLIAWAPSRDACEFQCRILTS